MSPLMQALICACHKTPSRLRLAAFFSAMRLNGRSRSIEDVIISTGNSPIPPYTYVRVGKEGTLFVCCRVPSSCCTSFSPSPTTPPPHLRYLEISQTHSALYFVASEVITKSFQPVLKNSKHGSVNTIDQTTIEISHYT